MCLGDSGATGAMAVAEANSKAPRASAAVGTFAIMTSAAPGASVRSSVPEPTTGSALVGATRGRVTPRGLSTPRNSLRPTIDKHHAKEQAN